MDFFLSAQELAFGEHFESFCREHIAPRARHADRTGLVPQESWNDLIRAGYLKLFHPAELGGISASGPMLSMAMETLGGACASTLWTTTISTALCGKLLWNLCRPQHHRRWLVPIIEGQSVGCFASTEQGSGNDPESYRTTVRRTAQGYVLSGEKTRVANAPIADVAVVLARDGDAEPTRSARQSLCYVVVDLRQQGVSRGALDPMGLRALPWGTLAFDKVVLAEGDVIRNASMEETLKSVEWGQLLQALCAIGLASAALSASVEYVKQRHAFGRPIGHMQVVHSRLADMRVEIEAARLLALHAASVMALGNSAGELVLMAKINATEMAVRVADAAMRTFGGWGYDRQFGIERLYRDSVANIPAGLTTDRLRELLMCPRLGVDPWVYAPFDWSAVADSI